MELRDRVNALQLALHQYRESASPYYDEVIDEVSARASERGTLGKADIGALVAWKRLNGNTRWMGDFMSTSDDLVRDETGRAREAAVAIGSDICQRRVKTDPLGSAEN